MRRSGGVAVEDGVELHYIEEGEGWAIVFVHGVWANARFFDRQIATLGRRFRAIAVDLRGHGQSSMTLKDQTIAVYARDLKTFLERLAVERPVLVGWSMGAFVVWDYMRQFGPDRIAATVIVDQAPSDLRSASEPDGLITVDALAAWHRRALTDRVALLREVIPMMFSRPPAEPDHRWMVEEMTRPPEVIAAAILVEQTFQDYRDVIEGSVVPTLVCYGEKSPQPRASMQWIARTALEGEAQVFEGCGHCLFLEAPEEFNRAVETFVHRVTSD